MLFVIELKVTNLLSHLDNKSVKNNIKMKCAVESPLLMDSMPDFNNLHKAVRDIIENYTIESGVKLVANKKDDPFEIEYLGIYATVESAVEIREREGLVIM